MRKRPRNTLYEKMLDRYTSLETVFGIWVPSIYAGLIGLLLTIVIVAVLTYILSLLFTPALLCVP